MSKKKSFKILLFGQAGSGKSAFIASMSKIDIFKYATAKEEGGANTTKITTNYVFSDKFTKFEITDCECVDGRPSFLALNELKDLNNKENSIDLIFDIINNPESQKKFSNITINLPYKGEIPENSNFDTITVRDTRGLGDISDSSEKVDDLGITSDVNAILLFSRTTGKQPTIFEKIIDDVLITNLRTPIFFLRRYERKTTYDVNFEKRILNNLEKNDKDLFDCVSKVGESDNKFRINSFVFKMPEVSKWAGVVYDEDYLENAEHEVQVNNYCDAVNEFFAYAISMYEKFNDILISQFHGEYNGKFREKILDKLLSYEAFKVAASIATHPCIIPKNDIIDRDTWALLKPPALKTRVISEKMYENEIYQVANQYTDAIIPSYSYACFNYRKIFGEIVYELLRKNNQLEILGLYSTFMIYCLDEVTIQGGTNYVNRLTQRDAFKFDLFIEVMERFVEEMPKNWIDGNGNRREAEIKLGIYTGSEAVNVMIYFLLIKKLKLSEAKSERLDRFKELMAPIVGEKLERHHD
jgi:hypothetical protein